MTRLERLASLTAQFTQVSRVRRRQIACVIREHLQRIGVKSSAAMMTAAAICHCDPEPWLTLTQTQHRLREMGLRVLPGRLYRLANRAGKCPNGIAVRWLDSEGRYVERGSTVAKARLTVRRPSTGPVEFALDEINDQGFSNEDGKKF